MTTEPPGAKATLSKASGDVVSINTTPYTISLDPKAGFFRGQTYKIKFELSGYQSTEVMVRPEISGWYFANIIFGGLIGMVIVDPATGSMWNLSPDKIDQPLSAAQASLIKNGKGFVVVLASQISERERLQMVRIH